MVQRGVYSLTLGSSFTLDSWFFHYLKVMEAILRIGAILSMSRLCGSYCLRECVLWFPMSLILWFFMTYWLFVFTKMALLWWICLPSLPSLLPQTVWPFLKKLKIELTTKWSSNPISAYITGRNEISIFKRYCNTYVHWNIIHHS